MQIIHDLERRPRGIYTGAIGFFSPTREAVLSVPIRTLVIEGETGVMDVGSGVTSDSVGTDEYDECLLKGRFITSQATDFCNYRSALWSDGLNLLPLHLKRMRDSATYFDYPYDEERITAQIYKSAGSLDVSFKWKVRYTLDRFGQTRVDVSRIADEPTPRKVRMAHPRMCSTEDLRDTRPATDGYTTLSTRKLLRKGSSTSFS